MRYIIPPPIEPERRAPGDPVNPAHLVLGLCASLTAWEAAQFTEFVDWFKGDRDAARHPRGVNRVVLRRDHEAREMTARGMRAAETGECLRFASVPARDGFPGGLLVLAALHPWCAETILREMRDRSYWMAMSVGADLKASGGLWLHEVSLVDKIGNQADEKALTIDDGRRAASKWELLTGEEAI